ncbi:sensor histidine kinase [Algoriphagus hitonicola]|uniref:histidine kinase n=1 Tax=Algoriphagus hitonicola TaxID=435880 RepID=A0A1I2NGN3_9BACT|nr:HAMP domain-containing sensor histidine kinase [Algoriphagus hitonicola]SFG02922.1 Histidine kinase-, DNA gyrase B-, and HSP90-like ATPase [Algoriphagus hitonicola]
MNLSKIDWPDSLHDLQAKISETFALLAGLLLLFLGASDYFLGLGVFIITVKFILAFPFFLGYFWMKKKGNHNLVIQLLLAVGLLAVTLNYFYNEGYRGPTIYTIFIVIVSVGIFIKKKLVQFIWLGGAILLYSTFFYLEIKNIIVVEQHYTGLENLFWDHIVTLLWCGLFVFFGVYIFVSNYQKQNVTLENLRKLNEQNLKELSEINLKKNQLLAMLTHDLKNPIGTLSTTLDLMDAMEMDERELDIIFKDLKNQSFHLNNVLNNTLSWVKTELSDLEAELVSCSLLKFSEELVKTMESQANRKNQHIQFEFLGEDRTLELEANEIRIILKNLLDNAIKFSPEGSTIHFQLSVDNQKIRWEVINSGISIPKEIRKNLFEFQVKSSFGTKREKGTGLGLHLCKKIADSLGIHLGFDLSTHGENRFFLVRENQ